MADLPLVRATTCAHGYLPIDTPPTAHEPIAFPNGRSELAPVWLCKKCQEELAAALAERENATTRHS